LTRWRRTYQGLRRGWRIGSPTTTIIRNKKQDKIGIKMWLSPTHPQPSVLLCSVTHLTLLVRVFLPSLVHSLVTFTLTSYTMASNDILVVVGTPLPSQPKKPSFAADSSRRSHPTRELEASIYISTAQSQRTRYGSFF
jgi:hypothetical protein